MLTTKFLRHLKREGWLKTYTRGHRASRHSHYIGANRSDYYVKSVGQDEFGNRYYEDFDVNHRNQRRWVEYTDYFMQMWSNGDKVPAPWHGWLCYMYDDVPTDVGPSAFVKPFYKQPHTLNLSNTPLYFFPQGTPNNPNRMKFIYGQRDRSRAPWRTPEGDIKFEGKKIIAGNNRQNSFDDVMSYAD